MLLAPTNFVSNDFTCELFHEKPVQVPETRSNKKLLAAKGIATRSKDATRGSWRYYQEQIATNVIRSAVCRFEDLMSWTGQDEHAFPTNTRQTHSQLGWGWAHPFAPRTMEEVR